MSTPVKGSLDEGIAMLSNSCAENKNAVIEAKNRMDEINTKCDKNNDKVDELNNKFDGMNDQLLKTTSLLEELMMKLSNSERKRSTEEINKSNIQMIEDKDNDSLSRSQLLFDHTHQSHYGEVVSPMTKNAAATPLSSHAIIIPPSSSIPTFSGKHSERPKQFLVRIQEYAETVHGWNRFTLLFGISQFLRDAALDWYCQLKLSGSQPLTWAGFVEVFLSQFNSPIRSARQEHEWYECKQKEDETINEFIIRLRALWAEQKPKELETDLVRHLLCKMRTDVLTMIGAPHDVTLDELIKKAQKVEEILYRRKKEERRLKYLNQSSTHSDTLNEKKSQYEGINKQPKPSFSMNGKYPLNTKTTFNQQATFNKRNTDRTYPTAHYYKQANVRKGNTQYLESMKCYNCGMWGINPKQTVRGDNFNWLMDPSDNSNSASRAPKLSSYAPTFGEQRKPAQQAPTIFGDWDRLGK
ncbi:unnamed protein product [Adineta steineri]|uniref:Retrotransposon gag domain-containing protein n=1 Tax=Adineta steineri TaxID=433720 RepID=A0A814T066_9BILA|nr:unnamed protein product [Adineta steineri]